MLLKYAGNDDILKACFGDTPHKFAICTLNEKFLLSVETNQVGSGHLTLTYNTISDILKDWEKVKETEVSNL